MNIGVIDEGSVAARVTVDDTTRVVYLQGASLYADLRFSPRVAEMCAEFAVANGGQRQGLSLAHFRAEDLRELAAVLADAGRCRTAPLPGGQDIGHTRIQASCSCAADVIDRESRIPFDHHVDQR